MEGETGFTRSIIDELHSSVIQGVQMGGESGVTRSILDELHSSDIEQGPMEGKLVLLQVSLMNLILRIPNKIKWKMEAWCYPKYRRLTSFLAYTRRSNGRVKVGLLVASLMNFILGTSREIKWKVEAWCYSKYH